MDRGYCLRQLSAVYWEKLYKSVKHARLAFSVQSIYGLGNWLPIYFARDAYIRQMLDMGYGEEYTQKMMSVLPNWTLPLIVILGMLGAYIGCTIGIRMLKKHFVKAGMAEEV